MQGYHLSLASHLDLYKIINVHLIIWKTTILHARHVSLSSIKWASWFNSISVQPVLAVPDVLSSLSSSTATLSFVMMVNIRVFRIHMQHFHCNCQCPKMCKSLWKMVAVLLKGSYKRFAIFLQLYRRRTMQNLPCQLHILKLQFVFLNYLP